MEKARDCGCGSEERDSDETGDCHSDASAGDRSAWGGAAEDGDGAVGAIRVF